MAKTHLTLDETRAIVSTFPRIPYPVYEGVTRAFTFIKQNFKQVQERTLRKNLSAYELELYDRLRAQAKDCPFTLFVYLCLKKQVGLCKECGLVTSFRLYSFKFQKFCSNDCSSPTVLSARKKTWQRRYGADNPTKTVTVRRKISHSVKATNVAKGISPLNARKRIFRHRALLPEYSYVTDCKDFYVYALLDTRKPGPFYYGHWKFEYEPFYIGKGRGDRAYSHLRSENISKDSPGQEYRNNHKKSKIRKIIKETGEFPTVCFKKVHLTEKRAFLFERRLISLIGRSDLGCGPLTNHTPGGEGVYRSAP